MNIRVKINKLKLNLSVMLLHSINREVVEENALWDSAMNTMERLCKGEPHGLNAMSEHLDILSERARERADDRRIEIKAGQLRAEYSRE